MDHQVQLDLSCLVKVTDETDSLALSGSATSAQLPALHLADSAPSARLPAALSSHSAGRCGAAPQDTPRWIS